MSGEGVTLSRRALVGGVVVVFVCGLAVKTLVSGGGAASSTVRASRATAGRVGPRAIEAPGVPVGFAHSRAGVTAAAVSYVRLGEVVLNAAPSDAETVLRRVASRDAADAFVAQEQAGFAQLREALARGTGTAHLRVGVLATRVEAFSPGRARVALWRVAVLSREGMTSPGEQWATVTYELVWEAGDWKIWSETSAAGPSPAAADARPASPSALEAALSGFVAYPRGQ